MVYSDHHEPVESYIYIHTYTHIYIHIHTPARQVINPGLLSRLLEGYQRVIKGLLEGYQRVIRVILPSERRANISGFDMNISYSGYIYIYTYTHTHI